MNDMKISPDDPRLTAYALGELEGDERAQFDAAAHHDPRVRAAIAEIRAVASRLQVALAKEPTGVGLEPALLFQSAQAEYQRSQAARPAARQTTYADDPYRRRKVARFPYLLVTSLAAACFAMVMALNNSVPGSRAPAETLRGSSGAVATSAPPRENDMGFTLSRNEKEFAERPVARKDAKATEPDAIAGRGKSGPPVFYTPPGEAYVSSAPDRFSRVQNSPLSSFGIAVDTASYTNVRRFLENGQRPPRDAVQIEGLINYFHFNYTEPKSADEPIGATTEVAAAPWNPAHRLVRIGVRGRETPEARQQTTVAEDVNLQVDFNPAVAQAYRLIGYENASRKNDNADKTESATEMGAGQSVTALYEVVPVGAAGPDKAVSSEVAENAALPAAKLGPPAPAETPHGELFTLKIRYKAPTVEISRKLEIPVIDSGAAFETASKDFKFAAAVASLGMILQESPHKGAADYDKVLAWAEDGRGEDADGRRREFIELVKKAKNLSAE
jgi:hypothetical protein